MSPPRLDQWTEILCQTPTCSARRKPITTRDAGLAQDQLDQLNRPNVTLAENLDLDVLTQSKRPSFILCRTLGCWGGRLSGQTRPDQAATAPFVKEVCSTTVTRTEGRPR